MPVRTLMPGLRAARRSCWACVLAAWAAAAGEAGAGDEARPASQTEPAAPQAETPPTTPASTSPDAAKAPARVSLQEIPAQLRGPDVTLIAGEERTVYVYRHNGQLRMIKVAPKLGPPYYLTPRDPTRGFGDLEQADSLIAEWVLREF